LRTPQPFNKTFEGSSLQINHGNDVRMGLLNHVRMKNACIFPPTSSLGTGNPTLITPTKLMPLLIDSSKDEIMNSFSLGAFCVVE
jgi:hypothetical protein